MAKKIKKNRPLPTKLIICANGHTEGELTPTGHTGDFAGITTSKRVVINGFTYTVKHDRTKGGTRILRVVLVGEAPDKYGTSGKLILLPK